MAEKNTLSILENIRKKIQKLDEPRSVENKDFSDLGDEFSYGIAPNKNEEVAQVNQAASKPESVKQVKVDETIEREIGESFDFDDDSLSEANTASKDDQIAKEDDQEDDHDFSLDHIDDDLEIEEYDAQEEVAKEVLEEAEEEVEEEALNVVKPAKSSDESAKKAVDFDDDDDYFLDDLEDEEDEEGGDDEEVAGLKAQPVIAQTKEIAQPKQDLEQDLKSDEEELEELLRQEQLALKTKEDKIAPKASAAPIVQAEAPTKAVANFVQEAAPDLASKPQTEKKFGDVAEFLKHENSEESLLDARAAANVSESIKKLVDAKNVVAGVTSFSKSEAFSDIAAQLMEPRLEKWLNEHLPELVERIVREEIKKIIPKE